MMGYCRGCYEYFRKGGKVWPIPALGTVQHDPDGKVICHFCGRSYTRLGSHAKESHGMTIKEYKERAGLCANAKTTEAVYSSTMSAHAYENGMDQKLIESGKGTRIKKGETDKRKGKEVRLQERIEWGKMMSEKRRTKNVMS